jgi:hypothetical protein
MTHRGGLLRNPNPYTQSPDWSTILVAHIGSPSPPYWRKLHEMPELRISNVTVFEQPELSLGSALIYRSLSPLTSTPAR